MPGEIGSSFVLNKFMLISDARGYFLKNGNVVFSGLF